MTKVPKIATIIEKANAIGWENCDESEIRHAITYMKSSQTRARRTLSTLKVMDKRWGLDIQQTAMREKLELLVENAQNIEKNLWMILATK